MENLEKALQTVSMQFRTRCVLHNQSLTRNASDAWFHSPGLAQTLTMRQRYEDLADMKVLLFKSIDVKEKSAFVMDVLGETFTVRNFMSSP